MPAIPAIQKNVPIALVLFGGGIVTPFVWNTPLGGVRPEHIGLARPSRGTITHTAGAAFLDDFGEGVGQLVLSGHTGWIQDGTPGFVKFKVLEAIFVEYLRRRKALAAAGQDPNDVKLWYLDVLNAEALSVYPHEFRLERTRSRPLLYLYHMRFAVLLDLLQEGIRQAVEIVGGLNLPLAANGLARLEAI